MKCQSARITKQGGVTLGSFGSCAEHASLIHGMADEDAAHNARNIVTQVMMLSALESIRDASVIVVQNLDAQAGANVFINLFTYISSFE